MMDVDEYVCPRPPTIHKRKKSVSRISSGTIGGGPSCCHQETRLSSSLFSSLSDDFFQDLDDHDDDDDGMVKMTPEKGADRNSCTNDHLPPLPPHCHPLHLKNHDHHHYGFLAEFDRGVSPTSVMDAICDPFHPNMMDQQQQQQQQQQQKKQPQYKTFGAPPAVPDLMASFSSSSSLSSEDESSVDGSAAAAPGTPSPKRYRQRIQKWSSFHKDGRDWGTSETCDMKVTQRLLDLLTMMEEEQEE
ncbi:unnamed protein product [Cylindrotheca closterium]|uniref:Uncharacterized protein n=1 Tax=Cylindrotheca closterium TaxID=2856 RepID=A0AAD2JJL9_9STRA|nr:unnamed protein product [Cylindrotheca closterium]